MAISRDDIVERNVRITNNNVIDMHVGKRVRSSPRWISRGDSAGVSNGEQIKDPMRDVKLWNLCEHITPSKSRRYASGLLKERNQLPQRLLANNLIPLHIMG